MKLVTSLVLFAFLVPYLVRGEVPEKYLLRNKKLCTEVVINMMICRELRGAAEKGGDKAAALLKKSQKACFRANRTDAIRKDLVKRKNIEGADRCNSPEDEALGLEGADKMIQEIESGNHGGKIFNKIACLNCASSN